MVIYSKQVCGHIDIIVRLCRWAGKKKKKKMLLLLHHINHSAIVWQLDCNA